MAGSPNTGLGRVIRWIDYRLPVPTLLVNGADDRVGDIATGNQEWAARDPMVELVVIPGAGHASNQDNPAAFTAALTAFLDRALPERARASLLGLLQGLRVD